MITIQEPRVELLILDRLRAVSFETVEQALLDALTQAPPPRSKRTEEQGSTGADILAAFQRCPDQDFEFGTERFYSPVSKPIEF